MKCPVCGAENDGDSRFCAMCGAPLPVGEPTAPTAPEGPAPAAPAATAPAHAAVPSPQAAGAPRSDAAPDPAPKPAPAPRRKAPVIIAVAAVALIALAGIAAFLVWGRPAAQPSGSAAPAKTTVKPLFKLASVKDPAFKEYLKDNVDTDHDGGVSQAEADAVTAIGAADQEAKKGNGLADLGIAEAPELTYFKNLTVLVISGNKLGSLDLSGNSKLQVLIGGGNQLTGLDLGANPDITQLSVPNNKIGSLDLSGEGKLTSADVSNNQMTELKLPAGNALTSLNAIGNALPSLDLSQAGGLTDVKLDSGTSVTGHAFTDTAAQSNIASMVGMYVDASQTMTKDANGLYGDPTWNGVEKVAPGNADIDRNLVYKMFNHSEAKNRGISSTNDGIYEVISPESVKKVLTSYYGTSPDDLGYISNPSYGLFLEGGSFKLSHADGAPGLETKLDAWSAYGSTVVCEGTVYLESDALPDLQRICRARFTLVADANSVYGYHLTSAVRL